MSHQILTAMQGHNSGINHLCVKDLHDANLLHPNSTALSTFNVGVRICPVTIFTGPVFSLE